MTGARPEQLARVAARVREHLEGMDRVVEALREALARWNTDPQELITVHWVAGLVHDFYTGLEKAFSAISPELNGQEHAGGTWHRDLLHAMTLELAGFRPAVLRRDLEPPLVELMKFRHVYRNLYSFDLRWERVRPLGSETLSMWPALRADLVSFIAAIEAMAHPSEPRG